MDTTPTCACQDKKHCTEKTKIALAWANTVLLALIFAAVSVGGSNGNGERKREWREEKHQPLQVISYGVATDGVYVYSNDQVIWKADPKTFVVIDSYYAKDAQHVYSLSAGYVGIIADADPSTFLVFSGGSMYAKDAAHVFYDRSVIPGADAQSFMALGTGGYAKDGTNVYYVGSPIAGADPMTFEISELYKTGYDAKDKDRLYQYGVVVTAEEAEEFLKNSSEGMLY